MKRSLLHLWCIWYFGLPRNYSAGEIDAVRQRLDVRLGRQAKIIGNIMAIAMGLAGCVGGIFFHARPAAWLMSLGMGRIIAYIVAAVSTSLLGILAGAVVVYIISVALGRNAWVTVARQAMRDIGRDVCVACGYWLRGLDDEITKCPECGTTRTPLPGAEVQ